jgi:hypothetical protein
LLDRDRQIDFLSRGFSDLPSKSFDAIRAGISADRSQLFKDLTVPFYGANRPDANVSQGVRDAFWFQSEQRVATMPLSG